MFILLFIGNYFLTLHAKACENGRRLSNSSELDCIRLAPSLQPETKYVRSMTAIQLNNLWSYIQGMSLKKKDREWLASKLLEPVDDTKTAQQKAFVKESLYRALDEVEQAKRGGRKLKTLDEFLDELDTEGV